ncbi:hypothetical protein QWY75_01745 [Pontixanthobacter aestiaquae]|uniref:Uncharacterized protein n=1 Tax=Pontixanthobacter aestiaquae TaxID=1509367 RepID=A0A844Z836_9SPHN|nr:hypothetical protein [Pontixanthobacter aestiaquae]MDN3644924.1 hypothetical protein [Pontixanthobacter aestiaquae]MXO84075.1 hypothetical protein [Pontixanthobacter aestiaquae]
MRNIAIIVLATALVILVAVFGFTRFGGAETNALVTNSSDMPISEVTISDGVNPRSLGDLAPFESAHFQGRLEGDGKAVISWQSDGKQYEGAGCDKSVMEAELEISGPSLTIIACR